MQTPSSYHAELDALLDRLAGIEAAIAAAADPSDLFLDAEDVRDAIADLEDRTIDAPDTDGWNHFRWRITDVMRAQRDEAMAAVTAALARAIEVERVAA